MNLKRFFVDQINFGFDDGLCLLENCFQLIRFNFKRDIFDLIKSLNLFIKLRYFRCENLNICLRFLLDWLNFLICSLSDFSYFFVSALINLRNILLIRLFDGLKRCDREWAVWIDFVRAKVSLLIEVAIMITKACWTVECFTLSAKCFNFLALVVGACLGVNLFSSR